MSLRVHSVCTSDWMFLIFLRSRTYTCNPHAVLLYFRQVKTNNFSFALHMLLDAKDIVPYDVSVLNELGVIYVQLDRYLDLYGYGCRSKDCVCVVDWRMRPKRLKRVQM